MCYHISRILTQRCFCVKGCEKPNIPAGDSCGSVFLLCLSVENHKVQLFVGKNNGE